MEFNDNGQDLYAPHLAKCESELHYCYQFLEVNNFKLIDKGNVRDFPYAVYQHRTDKNFYVELLDMEINIHFDNRTGDFVNIRNDYYSLLGVLIHHEKLSFFANKVLK